MSVRWEEKQKGAIGFAPLPSQAQKTLRIWYIRRVLTIQPSRFMRLRPPPPGSLTALQPTPPRTGSVELITHAIGIGLPLDTLRILTLLFCR